MLSNIEIPEFCPSCDSELEEVKGQLFCRNAECQAQFLSAISHFCSVLKIKGLGPKSIEKLGWSCIQDIYKTSNEVLEYTLGDKTAAKIACEINRSKSTDLVTLLHALGIPSIGEVAAKKICGQIDHITEIDLEVCKRAGIGPASTAKLLDWLRLNLETIIDMPFSFRTGIPKVRVLLGVTVCITGKIPPYKNREEASEYLRSLGFSTVISVGPKTDVLVGEVGENPGRQSSKIDKAKSLNIPILTIQQLLERYKIK